MDMVWLFIAIHAGLIGGGFLLAAMLRIAELERKNQGAERKGLWVAGAADPTGLVATVGYFALICNGIAKHWGTDGEGRRLVWLSAAAWGVCLGVMMLR